MPNLPMRRLALLAALALATLPIPSQAFEVTQQRGIASYYHHKFTGRTMANGDRFNPNSNTAAHRTFPFGTVVEVTNLRNGESRVVVITDRGPFIRGRIIDVSPRIAEELGMRRAGLAEVVVRPLGQIDTYEEVAEASAR
ncbi:MULTISPECIES: septal ring lytic transglycosylase RlpA family protein [Roseomonadaceae]|nr:septal ring lytic transglycosylase RlpA family protein [Roseomonas oleicola]